MKTLAAVAVAVVGSGVGLSTVLNDRAQIEESIPALPDGIVIVRIASGSVTIRGWDRAAIRVSARADSPDGLTLTEDDGHAMIRFAPEGTADGDAELTIHVPRESTIEAETDDARVAVEGVVGFVRLESESGDLLVNGDPAGIMVLSKTGNIDIRAPRARGLVHSEEGTVRLQHARAGDIIAGPEAARTQRDVRELQRDLERIETAIRRRQRTESCCTSDDKAWSYRGTRDMEESFQRLIRESAWVLEGAQDLVEVNRWDGGLRVNVADAVDVAVNLEALEALVESLGEDLEDEMRDLARDLERRYRDYAREFEREYERRR